MLSNHCMHPGSLLAPRSQIHPSFHKKLGKCWFSSSPQRLAPPALRVSADLINSPESIRVTVQGRAWR